MSKSSRALPVFAFLVATALCGNFATAQDQGVSQADLAQIYGLGVHAYFAGKYAEAEAVLTTAVDGDSRDPRVYYFRGLARLHQGNKEGATADFKTGAQIEASPNRSPVNVNQALMRIQGVARMQIEKVRATAKQEAAEQHRREQERRYNRTKPNGRRVLDRSRSGGTTS
ncbi:MAG: tetratricopeptide repeat protein [Pirellulales bacterium]|nr:tetratricopeptide repeat protein [Pirellulales bacterium]